MSPRLVTGGLPAVAGLLAVAISAANAQEAADSRFQLGTIEVIDVQGTKQADWATPFQAAITSDDMHQFERNDVSSALALMPGLTVQNSGQRSEKLIYVRGFNSRQVPLFIDGIPVYVPYDGNFDLSRLQTFDIAEIDVSKGFSSVLYGANSIGGSINLVSRRPQPGFHASFHSSTEFDREGDHSGNNSSLIMENNTGSWYVQANLAYAKQDFFTLPSDFIPRATEDGGRRENSETSDRKVALKLGYTPNATDEYAVSYQNQDGEKETPPYAGYTTTAARFWRWPQYDKESLYFISRTALNNTETVRTRLFYDTFANIVASYDNATYTTQTKPYAFTSIYDDYSWGASGEIASTRFDNQTLKAAVQFKRDVHREHNVGQPIKRMEDDLMSLGVEDGVVLSPALGWVIGGGWEQQKGLMAQDLIGTAVTPFPTATADGWKAQTALTYKLSDTWSSHASIARHTRFPTMKDRYSYKLGTAIPNPALEPESAVNMEVGVNGNVPLSSGRTLELSAALFQNRLDNTIDSVSIAPTLCSSPPCTQEQNIGRQNNTGVELGFTAHLGDQWDVHGDYSYLDRKNLTNPTLYALDTPKNKVFSYVRYRATNQLDFMLSSEHESPRYSTTNATRVTTPFTVTDLKASWRFSKMWQAEAGVRNLGDTLYMYEEGFPEPGRTWFLNLNVNF
ncbi:MAG TPA: TonB-dependent receptor [Candidatus Acidoferrum sp.]|nr:TonB-dependent receptor [Candidatus Acidoferrum sp.]